MAAEAVAEAAAAADPSAAEAPASLVANTRPYYSPCQVKHLSTREMFRSRNYQLNSTAFQQLWQKKSKEYRARCRARLAKRGALAAAKDASRAKREAKTAAHAKTAAEEAAHRREARGFEQLLRQNAQVERVQASGKGGLCIVPTDVLPVDAAGRIRLMVVPPAPHAVIKIGGKRAREALQLLDDVPADD